MTLTNVYDPQYNRGPADYDITHTLRVELDLRDPVGDHRSSTVAGKSLDILTARAACR